MHTYLRVFALPGLPFLLGGLSFIAPSIVRGGDGNWRATTGGQWADASKWEGGVVAGGVGYQATFATPITGSSMVTVDAGRVIGGIALDSTQQWHIAGNPLRLVTSDGSTPVVSVRGSEFHLISAQLEGSSGFMKSGPGGLILRNANTYSGVTVMEHGKIILREGGGFGVASGAGNGTVINASNVAVQLHLDPVSAGIIVPEDFVLRRTSSGSSNPFYSDKGDNTLSGEIILTRGGGGASAVHTFGVHVGAGSLTFAGSISGDRAAEATEGTSVDPNRFQVRTAAHGTGVVISGPISDGYVGSGGLSLYTVEGSAGVVRLTAYNVYSGSTVHEGGWLLVNNTAGSGTGTGSVKVRAALGGMGLVVPGGANDIVVENGGVVAPGDLDANGKSISRGAALTFAMGKTTGNLEFQPGARFAYDVDATATRPCEELIVSGLEARQPRVYFNNNVVDFTVTGSLLPDGLYTLVSFDAEHAYTGQLALGAGLEGHRAALVHNPRNIQLRIGAPR